MTLDEFRREQEEWRQNLIKREEKYKKRIPQLKKEYIKKVIKFYQR